MAEALLTIKDVIRVTKLSRTTIYALIRDRDLPTVRIGRTVRVRQVELDHWIISHEDSSDGLGSPPSPLRCPTCGGNLAETNGQKVLSLQKAAARGKCHER